MRQLTRQRIETAIATLEKQKARLPTAAEVRAFMGKGSFAYISPVLAEWRKNNLPDEASETSAIDRAMRAVRESLYEEANAHFEEECAKRDAFHLETTSTIEEFVKNNDELARQYAAIANDYQSALNEIDHLNNQADNLRELVAAMEERVSIIQGQKEVLGMELADSHKENARLSEKVAQQEKRLTDNERMFTTLYDANNTLKREKAELEVQKAKAESGESKNFQLFEVEKQRADDLEKQLTDSQHQVFNLMEKHRKDASDHESLVTRLRSDIKQREIEESKAREQVQAECRRADSIDQQLSEQLALVAELNKQIQENQIALSQIPLLEERVQLQITKQELYLSKLVHAQNEVEALKGRRKDNGSEDNGDLFEDKDK